MKIPVYPDNFFSFEGGVRISDETINEWIKNCVDRLEADQNANHTSTASGDARVDVSRYSIGEGSDDYYYSINVSRGYLHKDTDNYKSK